MGQFSPHPNHSAFGDGAAPRVGCSCTWGSIFMGYLELVGVTVLVVGRIVQSFLNLNQTGVEVLVLTFPLT